jgi:hypothetical protein
MASRAHVIHDYSLEPRQRRPLRFQTNDPVVLPRSRDWDISGGLIAAAVAATALVAAATYAVYYTEPPKLAATPTLSLERDYQVDPELARGNALKALGGPVLAAPDRFTSALPPADDGLSGSTLGSSSPRAGDEVIINDNAPGAQDTFPQPGAVQPDQSSVAPPATYPSPTSTPPDAIAPPDVQPQTPTPVLDPENPYR